jgi:hypothetical protein
MPNSLAKTNPMPPTPSFRDLQIYKGYVILNQDQVSIAYNFNISRPRISQIVRKVKKWLAAGGFPTDPAIRDHLAQQNLSHATKRIRLLRVIEQATHAAEVRLPSQVTTRHRYHGTTEVWRDEIRQQSPEVNLPALRLLLRAVKTLDELEAQPSASAAQPPTPAPVSEQQLLHSVFDLLCRWRSRAEAAGHFQRSADIGRLVADVLQSLLGPSLPCPLVKHDDNTLHIESQTRANLFDQVSAIETTAIDPTTDPQCTSDEALTPPAQKTSSKC